MLVSSVQGTEIAQTTAKPAATASAEAVNATKPYYFSPALVIDPKAGTAVLEYLNSTTGAVLNQYPSEKDIKAYTQGSTAAQSTTVAIAKPAEQPVSKTTDTVSTAPATAAAPAAVSQTAIVV